LREENQKEVEQMLRQERERAARTKREQEEQKRLRQQKWLERTQERERERFQAPASPAADRPTTGQASRGKRMGSDVDNAPQAQAQAQAQAQPPPRTAPDLSGYRTIDSSRLAAMKAMAERRTHGEGGGTASEAPGRASAQPLAHGGSKRAASDIDKKAHAQDGGRHASDGSERRGSNAQGHDRSGAPARARLEALLTSSDADVEDVHDFGAAKNMVKGRENERGQRRPYSDIDHLLESALESTHRPPPPSMMVRVEKTGTISKLDEHGPRWSMSSSGRF
jgi:hypothetical protein